MSSSAFIKIKVHDKNRDKAIWYLFLQVDIYYSAFLGFNYPTKLLIYLILSCPCSSIYFFLKQELHVKSCPFACRQPTAVYVAPRHLCFLKAPNNCSVITNNYKKPGLRREASSGCMERKEGRLKQQVEKETTVVLC